LDVLCGRAQTGNLSYFHSCFESGFAVSIKPKATCASSFVSTSPRELRGRIPSIVPATNWPDAAWGMSRSAFVKTQFGVVDGDRLGRTIRVPSGVCADVVAKTHKKTASVLLAVNKGFLLAKKSPTVRPWG